MKRTIKLFLYLIIGTILNASTNWVPIAMDNIMTFVPYKQHIVIHEDNAGVIHGGKLDNRGDGSYYKWDDSEAIRGLIFDAYQDFTLKSVKVYNQKGQESTRIFTLYDANGAVVDSKSIYVKAGVQRVSLNMHVPKGKGYKLMADIHKGLYKNDNVTGYPYTIGNVGAIISSDIDTSHYYFFYDWEVSLDKSIPTPPYPTPTTVSKAYIPKLDFSKDDVYNNGRIIHVSNSEELKKEIESAQPYTTILLDKGIYKDVSIKFPQGIHHITLKGEGDNTVIKPLGREEASAIKLPNVSSKEKQVHDINFIELNVIGELGIFQKGKENFYLKQFIKSVDGRYVDEFGVVHDGKQAYGPYNIYFYKVTFKNLFMGLYSHLYAHDWTVNACKIIHSTYSHFWYMMGWHLAVINSTFIDPTHDALAIRGYYPEGEVHTFIGVKMPETEECYGNRYVLDRGIRNVANGFLPDNDWTHIIVNNTFKGSSSDRGDSSQPFVVFTYGIYSDDQPCGAEKTYLPPQNVIISENKFDTHGGDGVITNAIHFDAWEGVNNNSLASINGITITDNTFIRKNAQEKFIKIGDSGNKATMDEVAKSNIKNNQIK